MKYQFEYSVEKDLILRETRSISFKEVIEKINKGHILDNIDHFNKRKYPSQKIFIVKIKNKAYAIPYVISHQRKTIFLKTIYPSRALKKKYSKK